MKIKKCHGGLRQLLVLLFFMVFVTYSKKCEAYTYVNNNVQFDSGDIYEIGSRLSLDWNFYNLENLTNAINTRIQEDSITLNTNIGHLNLLFFRKSGGDGKIYWVYSNGTYSNDLDYFYIYRFYSQKDSAITTTGQVQLTGLDHFNFNENNQIISATRKAYSIYTINNSDYTSTKTDLGATQGTGLNYVSGVNNSWNSAIVYVPFLLALTSTHSIGAYTSNGQGWYDVGNYIVLENDDIQPTPTPTPTETPTPTPTSSGGGGVDLTDTNNKIDQVNNNLKDIKNKIPTSGEITTATINANNDYWGNSGDLDGEKQEEEIQNSIEDIINNVSGEMTQNQTYQQLSQIENGFINFFEQGHDENWYDLIIKWGNVTYQNKTIIESGEINFSKMCREIPILGTIRTTIRTIFNFIICVSLVKQIWNLILATLGIDNPFLYEDPEEIKETYFMDTNNGTIIRNQRYKNWTYRRRM